MKDFDYKFLIRNVKILRAQLNLNYLPLEECIQEAGMAYVKAIKKFDPSKASLKTYAQHWIRGALLELARNEAKYHNKKLLAGNIVSESREENIRELVNFVEESGLLTKNQKKHLWILIMGYKEKEKRGIGIKLSGTSAARDQIVKKLRKYLKEH